MHNRPEHHSKPTLDAEKAPYGHSEETPLAPVFPEEEVPPVIELLGDEANETSDASETPEAAADSAAALGDGFREIVRARPLASIMAAAAIGALLVKLSE